MLVCSFAHLLANPLCVCFSTVYPPAYCVALRRRVKKYQSAAHTGDGTPGDSIPYGRRTAVVSAYFDGMLRQRWRGAEDSFPTEGLITYTGEERCCIVEWKNVYLFISSTFNDMHAERDYLTKRVFPELAAWCAERKLRLYDIDLRWGISEEDAAENKRVVDICLSSIDTCRPFFLSFLGQRRGWSPTEEDISAETCEKFPGLVTEIGKRSITELEVYHALKPFFDAGQLPVQKSASAPLFFFRSADYLPALEQTDGALRQIYTNHHPSKTAQEEEAESLLLETFKAEMQQRGFPCYDYTARWDGAAYTPELKFYGGEEHDYTAGRLVDLSLNGKPLKDTLLAELKQLITQEFGREADATTPSSLERELAQQDLFLTSKTELYIANSRYEQELRRSLADPSCSLTLIAARAGMGKTTFMANMLAQLLKHTTPTVLYRFVGTSNASSTAQGLVSSLYEELLVRGLLAPEELPENPQHYQREFSTVLGKAAQNARRAQEVQGEEIPEAQTALGMQTVQGAQETKLLLFLDGLNQLSGSVAQDFAFLSAKQAEGVQIVASVKTGESATEIFLHEREQAGAHLIAYEPFPERSMRKEYIQRYLDTYLKTLSDTQMEALLSSEGARNPLYMSIVLSELRLFGSFEGLMSEITRGRFGQSPEEAYDAVLERLEGEAAYCPLPPDEAVPLLFGSLALSRLGLSSQYFVLIGKEYYNETYTEEELLDTFFHYLHQLRDALVLREGRYTFLYESLRLACAHRYEAQAPERHARLARLMRREADPRRDGSWSGSDTFALRELVYHTKHVDEEEAHGLLNTFAFLDAKLRATETQALLDDCALFTGEDVSGSGSNVQRKGSPSHDCADLHLLAIALAYAAPALDRQPEQFVEQLWLRLYKMQDPRLQTLLAQAAASKTNPWLKALQASTYEVNSGLSQQREWPSGEHELMEVSNRELFIRSSCSVSILDSQNLATKQVIPLGFETEPVRTCRYTDSYDIPTDLYTRRFSGVTKVGRKLVCFYPNVGSAGTGRPARLRVYCLDNQRWFDLVHLDEADLSAPKIFSRKALKKFPFLQSAEAWLVNRIFIEGNSLHVLFSAEKGFYGVKSYELSGRAETGTGTGAGAGTGTLRSFPAVFFELEERVEDFLCNGTLAYFHISLKNRREFYDLRTQKRIQRIEEGGLKADQLCYFDGKFFINNKVFDGKRGRVLITWPQLCITYVGANENYLVATAHNKNLRENDRAFRTEFLNRERAGDALFWQRGDELMRVMYRVVYARNIWRAPVGAYAVLELQNSNKVGLFDLTVLFNHDHAQPGKVLTPQFGAAFTLDLRRAYQGRSLSYAIDLEQLRLISAEDAGLSVVQSSSDIAFEGSVYPRAEAVRARATRAETGTSQRQLWFNRMQNLRGRVPTALAHHGRDYFLTGEKLLIFSVSTQEVEAFVLPEKLALTVPEGTLPEVWEAVLRRSGDTKVEEKMAHIRLAQSMEIKAVEDETLYLAAGPEEERRFYRFAYREGVCEEIFPRSFPVSAEASSSRFAALSQGRELRLIERDQTGADKGEPQALSCLTLGETAYPSLYFTSEDQPQYVKVHENLIFVIQQPEGK